MSETTPDLVPSSAPKESGGVGAAPSDLPGRWGHRHSASIPEGLAGLAARGQEPVAPGPTVDDLRADLVRRDVILAQVAEERDAAQHQLREALAELAAMRDHSPEGGKKVNG